MQCYYPRGYGLACDHCGKELTLTGRKVFVSAYAAVATAKNLGWKVSKASPYNDYCPECRKRKVV